MGRIVATLAVVGALLFSAGESWGHDRDHKKANELFVEATMLVLSAQSSGNLVEKASALGNALEKLKKIIMDYRSSDLAVKLISGQQVGFISLSEIDQETKKIQVELKIAADERAKFENILEAAKQGDAEAQFKVGASYQHGWGVSLNLDNAIQWYRKAAEQGDIFARRRLVELKTQ